MNERPRLTWSQVVGVTAVLAIVAAVVYPFLTGASPARAAEGPESGPAPIAETANNMSRIRQAMQMYALDHGVDDVPGVAGFSRTTLGRRDLIMSYLPGDAAARRATVHSPAAPPPLRAARPSTYVWRSPSPELHSGRGFAHQQAEFEADPSRFVFISDDVIDAAYYYPRERDQALGALIVDMDLAGRLNVQRRPFPRIDWTEMMPRSRGGRP